MITRLICAAVIATGAYGAVATSGAAASTLSGTGSALVAPLVAQWSQGFDNSTGNVATYSPAGSAAGVAAASTAAVDFGASDLPLSLYPTECSGCSEIPWAVDAVAVGYNVPGIGKSAGGSMPSRLRLTGAILARIYLGQITTWNDPAIVKLNRSLKLPKLKITPVWRGDASAETYTFTQYLSAVSGSWAAARRPGTTSSFVTGIGEFGDSGVAAAVAKTRGAIGYMSESDLLAQHVAAAAIQNAAGSFEQPQFGSVSSAAAAITSVSPSGVSIVDPSKTQTSAYPIAMFTYAVIPAKVKNVATLQQFLGYVLTAGGEFGVGLGFAPVPANVLSYDESAISAL